MERKGAAAPGAGAQNHLRPDKTSIIEPILLIGINVRLPNCPTVNSIKALWPKAVNIIAILLVGSLLATHHPAFPQSSLDEATALTQQVIELTKRGQYSEAVPLAQRALALVETALGPDNPAVAVALSNVANLYQRQARYSDAEPLYKRSLAIREQALGPDHPDVATNMTNLALLYRLQGRYADAEPLYRQSLIIQEKTLGLDHPDVALILDELAALYYSEWRYADAEPLFRRALTIREARLGPIILK